MADDRIIPPRKRHRQWRKEIYVGSREDSRRTFVLRSSRLSRLTSRMHPMKNAYAREKTRDYARVSSRDLLAIPDSRERK